MIKDSGQYLADAAAALELARGQNHSPEAMKAHVQRAAALMAMYDRVSVREVEGLFPVAPPAPVAVLDCHEVRWELDRNGTYTNPPFRDLRFTPDELAARGGPLRPAEQSR